MTPILIVAVAARSLQEVMHPSNTEAQRKLLQLPILAMEVLLGSPELKVASENTAVAAASFWLQYSVWRQGLLEEDVISSLSGVHSQLISKLRLCQCSPSYLMACLNDGMLQHGPEAAAGCTSLTFWLKEQLDGRQQAMLIWGANRVALMRAALGRGMPRDSLLDLKAAAGIGIGTSWWLSARPQSSVTCGEMKVEVALSYLATEGRVESEPSWYAGYNWKLEVVWSDKVDEMGKTAIEALLYCDKGAIGCSIPVAFEATVAAAYADAGRGACYREMSAWQIRDGWDNFFGQRVGSVADASNVLGEFVHADGKLHFTAQVSNVS
jgi:hypothetical protein